LTCIFLCGISLTDALSQEGELSKANRLFDSQQYFEAAIEYERIAFNSSDAEMIARAKYGKELSHRYQNKFSKALHELNGVFLPTLNNPLRSKILYEKALNHYLLDQEQEALWELNKIKNSHPHTRKVIPLKILSLNKARKFDKAYKTLITFLQEEADNDQKMMSLATDIQALYSKDNLPKAYKEQVARDWSRFIPGAGQIYSKHPGEGMISLLLNGALIIFGIHQIWNAYYFTGYMAGFGVMYKTYTGGMTNAANLAKTQTHNEMVTFNQQVISIIQEIN
jgi:TM2 domain-containing membrane protein YozV